MHTCVLLRFHILYACFMVPRWNLDVCNLQGVRSKIHVVLVKMVYGMVLGHSVQQTSVSVLGPADQCRDVKSVIACLQYCSTYLDVMLNYRVDILIEHYSQCFGVVPVYSPLCFFQPLVSCNGHGKVTDL